MSGLLLRGGSPAAEPGTGGPQSYAEARRAADVEGSDGLTATGVTGEEDLWGMKTLHNVQRRSDVNTGRTNREGLLLVGVKRLPIKIIFVYKLGRLGHQASSESWVGGRGAPDPCPGGARRHRR